jgi:branched-chain amino acid transport system ATP-binding protein
MPGLGRALARRPSALLIEELSLGLAPVIVQRLLPIIRQFATQAQAAVLLAKQHVQIALEISDRAYVFVHGDVVFQGSARELVSDRQLSTNSYLGDMTKPAKP